MKLAKPMLISFALLAFASASAYAAGDAKEKSASQASSEKSASQASSGGSSAAQKDKFSKLDMDGDGFVGRSEAAADEDAKSRFEKLDANKDQKLSQQEYQAWGSAAAGASGTQSQPQKSQSAQSQQGKEQSASAGASSGKSGQAQKGQMQVSKLIGTEVTNAKGEDLGEIKDVVIDMQGGKVHAAVLEFGGTLGLGEKNYAFPISQLKPGKGDKVMLNVDKEKLKNAEGFAQNEWPAMNDEYWGRVGGQASAGASKSQGQKQSQAKKKMNLMRASELIGQNVQDKSGNDVGEIKDIMVSLGSGQLRNIVLDLNEGGQAMVQAKSLQAGTEDKLVINMSAEQLKSQAKKSGASTGGATTGGTGDPKLPSSGGGK